MMHQRLERLRELFREYERAQLTLLREYRERQRLITDVIKEHDHADESRPE